MSYTPTRQLGDLDDLVQQAKDAFERVQPALEAGQEILTDPYLPETACRVLQLSDLEKGKAPRTCIETAPGKRGGIGLRLAIKPLRGFVWAREHPALAAAGAAAAVTGVFLLGYVVGRR